MVPYLINTTAIWLISLVVFDVFLRKESFHGYNRIYLLGTLLLGALLPLWSWQDSSVVYFDVINKPAEQVAIIKETIAETNPVKTFIVNWKNVLLAAYILGAAAWLIIACKELLLIKRFIGNGISSKDGVWTIIETGGSHAPFSAFRYVFISSKSAYSEEQLKLILAHEEQHGHLLHFVDIIIVQCVKILFWFHPLVYAFNKRLLIIHEYQADSSVDASPGIYGNFLLEQAMLGNPPFLAHSFSQSPVKNRLLMLTQKKTSVKFRMLVAIPVLLLSVLCFTKDAFSDSKRTKDGNKVTYRGNVFELSSLTIDTIFMQDPASGEMILKIAKHEPVPVSMNGDTIYQSYAIKDMIGKGLKTVGMQSTLKAAGLRLYLLDNLKEEISKLDDGKYWLGIGNVVVDKNGKVVYYDYAGLKNKSPMIQNKPNVQEVDFALQDKIGKKVAKLIKNMPAHSPALLNGKEVNSVIDGLELWNTFEVKDGKVVSL